jgi:drug/metabolite transporter (DMT)-like permease
LYIAVFFVVSQVISVAVFGERPAAGVLAGGALIVSGGVVMLLEPR